MGAPAPSRRRGAHSRPSSRRWRRARATPGRAGPGPGSSEWKTTWPQTIDKGARAGRPSAAHARKQAAWAEPRPPAPSVGPAAPRPRCGAYRGAGRPFRPGGGSRAPELRAGRAPGDRGGVDGPGAEGRGKAAAARGRAGRWGTREPRRPGPRRRGRALCLGPDGNASSLIHVTSYR